MRSVSEQLQKTVAASEQPIFSAVNELAADRLCEAAALLAHQGDNAFRVAAYRRAAEAVAAL